MLFGKSKKAEADAKAAHHDTIAIPANGWNSDSDNPPGYDDNAPPYQEEVKGNGSSTSRPDSASQSSSFYPTAQLQIQAIGYDYSTAVHGMNFEQISVYCPQTGDLAYTSLRLDKKSNSCALIRGSDASSVPLLAIHYRWGPGRPPKIKIIPRDSTATIEEAINSDEVPCELVEVRSRNMFSRAQIIDTSLGTFEWRYGSREERKAAHDAQSLLIMDKIESVPSAGGLKTSKKSTRVAQLVRNDEFRTPGTNKHMGGNGGRLMMDLSSWTDGKNVTAKDVEAFAVASCICMLKREADRFKNNAVAVVT